MYVGSSAIETMQNLEFNNDLGVLAMLFTQRILAPGETLLTAKAGVVKSVVDRLRFNKDADFEAKMFACPELG